MRFSPSERLTDYLKVGQLFFPHYTLQTISDMESSFMSWWHVRVDRDTDFRTFTYQCDQIQLDMKQAKEAQAKAAAAAKKSTSK